MKSLTDLMNKYVSDKGTAKASIWAHGYSLVYGKLFKPLREKPVRLLEIGIDKGASLKAWRDFFKNGLILGIDVLDCSALDCLRIKTFRGDQGSREDLALFLATFGGDLDLVIDDGCHRSAAQQTSLAVLLPHVVSGGLYAIEDLKCKHSRETAALARCLWKKIPAVVSGMTEEELAYVRDHSAVVYLKKKLVILRKV